MRRTTILTLALLVTLTACKKKEAAPPGAAGRVSPGAPSSGTVSPGAPSSGTVSPGAPSSGTVSGGRGGDAAPLGAAGSTEPSAGGGDSKVVVSAKPLADRWLAVLSSSKEPGTTPPGVATLLQHPELPRSLMRVNSTELRGLMPCYEVLVAQSFADLTAAKLYSEKLRALGVDHYLKNAGRFVGKQHNVLAYCRRERQAPTPTRCADLHWVEQREGRSYLRLQLDPAVAARVPAPTVSKPVGPAWDTWTAPLSSRTLGAYSVNQRFLLHTGNAAKAAGTCTLRAFLWLTRGTPHFGYIQEAREKKAPPAAPGCGSPELYAEIDCGAAKGTIAQREGAPEPGLFTLSPPITDAARMDGAKAALQTGGAYLLALKIATHAAKAKGQPLQQTYRLRELRGRKPYWLLELMLSTGEGANACGQEDVRMDLVGVAELGASGAFAAVAPLRGMQNNANVSGAFELGPEKTLALLLDEAPSVRRLISSKTHQPLCELTVPYCDCGC